MQSPHVGEINFLEGERRRGGGEGGGGGGRRRRRVKRRRRVIGWKACSGEGGREGGRENKKSTGVESIRGDEGAGVEV